MDKELLAKLNRDQETQRDGRSAVLRRAVAEYLQLRRQAEIAEGYKRAYSKTPGLGREFENWEHQGKWPPE